MLATDHSPHLPTTAKSSSAEVSYIDDSAMVVSTVNYHLNADALTNITKGQEMERKEIGLPFFSTKVELIHFTR
jgi:hypothetical protein